jgi:hypothetical protein
LGWLWEMVNADKKELVSRAIAYTLPPEIKI